jgi:hypothetical protein
MSRRPNREKEEVLTPDQLKDMRRSLARVSPSGIRDAYDKAYRDCRLIYKRIPSPLQMQTLVQVWKQLRKWK